MHCETLYATTQPLALSTFHKPLVSNRYGTQFFSFRIISRVHLPNGHTVWFSSRISLFSLTCFSRKFSESLGFSSIFYVLSLNFYLNKPCVCQFHAWYHMWPRTIVWWPNWPLPWQICGTYFALILSHTKELIFSWKKLDKIVSHRDKWMWKRRIKRNNGKFLAEGLFYTLWWTNISRDGKSTV